MTYLSLALLAPNFKVREIECQCLQRSQELVRNIRRFAKSRVRKTEVKLQPPTEANQGKRLLVRRMEVSKNRGFEKSGSFHCNAKVHRVTFSLSIFFAKLLTIIYLISQRRQRISFRLPFFLAPRPRSPPVWTLYSRVC